MYSVSADFLTAMAAPVQQHKVKGTIGSATFGPVNILAGSFSINAKLCSEQEIQIGQVYITELSATFRNVSVNPGEWQGKVITPTFSLKTENGWEDVPLGVFTVQEATISASGVTVKAYDNMAKFDKYCTTYRGAGGGAGVEGATSVIVGRTTYDMLQMICHKVGVDFGMTRMEVAALPNSGNGWDLFSDNDITTYRDMLSWMAQTLACNATINREGKLVLVPFKSASDYTFDDEHRHEGASFKDFTTRITEISLDCKPMEKSYSYHVTPNNGLSYGLGQNPYLQIGTAEDRDDAMNDILTALQEVNYTPFDVNLTGCPIFDLGDVLTFTGGITGGLKKGAVTSFTYTYNAAYKLACGGKNPAEAKSKSATDKRMDGINSSVTSQGKPVMVVRNAESVTLGDGSEVTVIDYPFEVTDSVNLTIVSTQILMTTEATETEAGDVFTIGDIVARAILYLDGIEIGDLYPEFIVDEGTDTINFDYSLKNLTVGAHNYTVKLELSGGDGEISENDVHESLWGYGITFEVYLKAISVTNGRSVFRIGETLDTSDWNVRGINNNGTIISQLTGWTTDPVDGTLLDERGEMDVEVNYEEASTNYPIEVVYAPYDGCKVYFYDQSLRLWDENGNKETVRSISSASLISNDHEFISWRYPGIVYEGRDVQTSSSPAASPEAFEMIDGAKNGYIYSSYANGERTFHYVVGNSEEGDISETDIGSYSGGSAALNRFLYVANGVYKGDVHPFVDASENDVSKFRYGYVDTKTGSVVPAYIDLFDLGFGASTGYSWASTSCRLENGDAYFFVGYGVPKIMHTYINGQHNWYDLSSIDSLAYRSGDDFKYGLYHDKVANCLVLYISRITGFNTPHTYCATNCYKLNMNGHTVIGSVALPAYLDVPVSPDAGDIRWNEQADYFRVWMNVSNINTYTPETVDGIRASTFDLMLHFSSVPAAYRLSKPRNYVDFSAPDFGPADRQYLIGTTYNASVNSNAQRCVYVDNLYMQDSAGNVVKEW